MSDYPLYNLFSLCVKCGAGNPSTSFVSEKIIGMNGKEALERKCSCGYSWFERPLDQMTSQEKEQLKKEHEKSVKELRASARRRASL